VRIRHHVNPLKAGYYAPVAPLALPEGGEVEVELGCAEAQFLFQRAAAHPAVTCVGVEIRADLVDEVNARAAQAGLGNLRAVFAHVNQDLDALFPDGRLARVYLNFPDPWFKRRHHKRRVLTGEVVAAIERKLAPDGELLFQSDVFELALEAMATLEQSTLLSNARGPWSFLRGSHPFGARSLREERCEERGLPIWRMLYARSERALNSSGSDTSQR
jgi:tRNA (guanine-N7-)-methyltransferase